MGNETFYGDGLTAFRLKDESISALLEKTLVHVTLMTIPHWLRYAH